MYEPERIAPTAGRILVARDALASSSPILIAEAYAAPPLSGTVLRSASEHVPAGSTVWWAQQAGHPVPLTGGREGVLLSELEVLAYR